MLKQEPSQPSSGIDFVNDWGELQNAVRWLRSHGDPSEFDDSPEDYAIYLSMDGDKAIDALVDYVPRLIKQYEELWELSQNLLQAVEQELSQKQRLVTADNSDMQKAIRELS